MKTKTAVVDITPLIATWTIRSRTRKLATHPTFTLEANIIVVCTGTHSEMAIINIDSVFSSTDLESRIREYSSHQALQLLIIATHTHNAPVMDPTFLDGLIYDEEVVDSAARRIAKVIDYLQTTAFATVRLSTGQSDAPGSVYRRKNTWTFVGRSWPLFRKTCSMVADRNQPIPRQLVTVIARSETGEVQFLLWSWPCHATATSDAQTLHADFPGEVRWQLREQLMESERLPVVYLPGLCGDIRPDSSSYFSFDGERLYRPFARQFVYRSAEWTRQFSMRVANSTKKAISLASETFTNDCCTVRISSMSVTDIFAGQSDAKLTMTRLSNGDLDLLFFSAEICSSYQVLLQNIVDKNTICSGLAGQVYGYLPSDEQIKQGGYEVSCFTEAFSLKGEYRPAVQDTILIKVANLYEKDVEFADSVVFE